MGARASNHTLALKLSPGVCAKDFDDGDAKSTSNKVLSNYIQLMEKNKTETTSRERHLPARRSFLKHSALTAMGLALGGEMVFAEHFPPGLNPLGLTSAGFEGTLPGKHPELILLNDRPINAEAPAHLLDDAITPADRLFVRNNGIPPEQTKIDLNNWTLTIEGESATKPQVFSLQDLKSKFKTYTYQLTVECGGNGRHEFNPPADGLQWSLGAVGCAAWTGVRLRDVLNAVGIKSNAQYIGYYGKDTHLNGKPDAIPISRGVPMDKALQEESLIAWAVNGQAIPWLNGYPLRLVFGGWPGSCSGKWLSKIVIRDRVHDGPKMTGSSYRVPCQPVAPGSKVADEDMCIIESMPVKSLITYPRTGATIQQNQQLPIRGHAWAGEYSVQAVHYSIDFGASWQTCILEAPANRFAWQHFRAKISFQGPGYYEVWARATDSRGISQPMILPGWNPKGYLNNACHRIAVKVN
ncbi:MAG: molybdopterin containing oxidoreductase [Saprospiraceae bacterium]|nr:MAG: molybdopterin containing oxidoreductase [Saprospiraceae bacterium]